MKLKYDEALSNSAFNFKLRRYSTEEKEEIEARFKALHLAFEVRTRLSPLSGLPDLPQKYPLNTPYTHPKQPLNLHKQPLNTP